MAGAGLSQGRADFVAGAMLWQRKVQILWQAAHFARSSTDFAASAFARSAADFVAGPALLKDR